SENFWVSQMGMRARQKHINSNLIWLCLLFGFLLVIPIVLSPRVLAVSAADQISQNPVNGRGPQVAERPTSAPVTYHYGPIQDSQNIYAIFWLPSGDHFESSGNGSHFD